MPSGAVSKYHRTPCPKCGNQSDRCEQIRWRVRYEDAAGKWRSETYKSKGEANRRLTEVKASLNAGKWTDPKLGKTKLAAFYREWSRTQPPNRRAMEARNASLMRNHVLPRFGDVSIASIRRADVQEWTHELSRRLAPSTVAKAKELLGKVLAAAVDDGLIPANPCAKVKVARGDDDHDDMRFLTPDELKRLADVIDFRYRALVLVGGWGGLRIGELAGLQRRDVDALRGVLSIERQVTEVGGKLQLGPLKTKAARRKVKLPRFVMDELTAHMATYVRDDAPTARIFTAPNGGLLSRTTFRSRIWAPATATAGLEGLTPHALRHTAVSLWIATGANPKQVAVRAGHTSVRTVYDVYGHLLPNSDDELVDRLETMARSATDNSAVVIPLER
jgi:integrase